MAKKISFDDVPAALDSILKILTAETSEHSLLPTLLQRVTLIEKKIDHLQRSLSTERPTMDMHRVCRVLKLRPKAVNELVLSGALPSVNNGRKMLIYEDGVVRYFMNLPTWKEAAESVAEPPKGRPGRPKKVRPVVVEAADAAEATIANAPEDVEVVEAVGGVNHDAHQRVDINAASLILGRSTAAIRQQLTKIPYYRDGRSIYFFADEIAEWAKHNRPRPRKNKA